MMQVSKIELDTSAMQSYARYLQQAPAIAREEFERSTEASMMLLTRAVKENTPTKTGNLRASEISKVMRGAEITNGLGVVGIISTSLSYAIPVELGTKPHDIVAKNGRALAFTFGGNAVVFKKVRHPGTKGAFMFKRTMEDNADQVNRFYLEGLSRIVARLQSEST